MPKGMYGQRRSTASAAAAVRWRPVLLLLVVAFLGPHARGGELPAGARGRISATGEVSALALSTEGRLLATASTDRNRTMIQLWEAATGRRLREWDTPEHAVRVLAFAPDGSMLATGGSGWVIHFWDTASGKPRGRLVGHADEIRSLVFSPDGSLLASTAGRDRTVYLWDVSAGKELHQLHGRAAVLGVAFSADGKTLFAAGEDGNIQLHQTATGRLLGQLEVPGAGALTCAALCPDSQTIALASRDGRVSLWDLATGKPLRRLQSDELKAQGLAFSSDGRLLAGFDRGSIHLWETASGQQLAEWQGHQGQLHGIAFAADGRTLASASANPTALVWDLTLGAAAGKEVERLWSDLAGEDAVQAQRAVWALTALPERVVPLLEEKLKPTGPADPDRLRKLIVDLDHDSFAVREGASRELRALGVGAERALRETMRGQPTPEVRRRVQELLDIIEQRPGTIPPDELWQLRAVQVLEQIGSSRACQVLEGLARRSSSGRPVQDARAALARLDRRAASGR